MNNNFQEYNEKEYNNVEKKEKKKSIRNKVTLFIVLLIVCFFSTYFIVDRLTNSKYKDVSDNQSKTAVYNNTNLLSDDMLSIIESNKYEMLFLNSTYDIASNELNDQVNKIQSIITKYDKDGILAGEGPLMKDLVKISDTDFNNVNNSSIICILLIMLFVLKSYTLPLLLISVIEFAIFTNMAVPYFSGELLPFVAPIVLGTIQLGATIDYAILMTTTYLTNRRSGKEKEDGKKKKGSIFSTLFSMIFGSGIAKKVLAGGATLLGLGLLGKKFSVKQKDADGNVITTHTCNKVPFIICDKNYKLKKNGTIKDIIPTIVDIYEISKPKEMTGESLIIKETP